MTTLLVVEDEAVVALDIESRLAKAGYQVCGTSNGKKAITYALERKPDLVLMDIHIKGDIDGIETAKRIRQQVDIPVIFLTSYADQEVLQRAKDSDPFGYVVKPFEDRELHAAIQIGLHRHKLSVQAREANEWLQREIMERQRAEEALRQSEERYALATRAANDGIWDWNLSTGRLYTSPHWKEMLGYSDGEVGGAPWDWLGLIHADDRDAVRGQIASHLGGTAPHFECEYRILHRDGSYRWMLCRGLATLNEEGTPVRFAGTQTEITSRRRVSAS